MIDDAKFKRGIALLQQHFNRTLSDDAIAIWREFLDDNLSDEDFTQAIKEAVLSCEFFPTAKKLVEFAIGALEVAAIQQWQIIVTAASTVSETWIKELLGSLSERSRASLQAIGGLQAVAMTDDWSLRKLEKQFITVYCQSPSKIKLLPPAKIQPINYEAEPVARDYTPPDPSTKPEALRRVLEALDLRVAGLEQSDESKATNTFFLRYRWKIDEDRLSHYLNLDLESKRGLLLMMDSAFRDKASWRSAAFAFDKFTGYKAGPAIDARAIARRWLEEEEV
ncbi:hypothetical protein VF14_32635 [Nostoc linckia z18]|uniref:Uncharacterized protein n=2 Tax=Nostoc linckia TaxID=92942 RepID=A0A9Q6EIN9_NOSLI|nr:hypothetical protein [Nostoc linckia]PHK33593.1 hypothetical protein VF12_25060 [Nostoc linckia z15]PHK44575.1 hypothetical protein VF13_21470 [Nostoc linckia z16]PHJ59619.1 hypothetical protein VF02_24745 [Nostoc linckia z1]PHJ59911.1 hypothetical protein VF03_33975 [Nostoc linckia z2]PHJ65103.1 hypothetical protein VF05_21405 [Nostoc linckia z3]